MDAGVPGWLRGVVGVVGLLAGVVGLGLALLALWVVLLVWNAPQVLQHNGFVTLAILAVVVAKGVLTVGAAWAVIARGAWRTARRGFEAAAWLGLASIVVVLNPSGSSGPPSGWSVLLRVAVPLGLAAACVWAECRVPASRSGGRRIPSA